MMERGMSKKQNIEIALSTDWDVEQMCELLNEKDPLHSSSAPANNIHRRLVQTLIMLRFRPEPGALFPRDWMYAWVTSFCAQHGIALCNQRKITACVNAVFPKCTVRKRSVAGKPVDFYVGLSYVGDDPGWEYRGDSAVKGYPVSKMKKIWEDVMNQLKDLD